jgi:glycosyltransferase involved in cell wall biosynthesis
MSDALVQVVGPEDGWVLERLAHRLARKLPYAAFVPDAPRPVTGTQIAYYVNYALYRGPSGLIDVGFFTHEDEAQDFLPRARRMDYCVCMSRLYADGLKARGVQGVAHIPMGFDAYRYRPRLILGVVGRLDHPRKGRALVERLRRLPFVEVVVTDGQHPEDRLWDLYQRLDYVLIPATVEGGPMSLLEGLGMGKPVIAPEGVGMVPEFGPTAHILRYPAGDAEALAEVVTACYREKQERARLVADRTWDSWAEGHHRLFMRLLAERGLAMPEPAPGFRFGMLSELELPPGGDLEPLEATVDRAAKALFFGRYRAARAALEAIAPSYPCVDKLQATIPGGEEPTGPTAPSRAHPRALR